MLYNKKSELLLEDNKPQSIHAVITDPPYGIGILQQQQFLI